MLSARPGGADTFAGVRRYNICMRYVPKERRNTDPSGKLHIYCPHRDRTGITVHVVIRNGVCYRSRQCMVLTCKFNMLQSDLQCLLSLTW